MFDILIAIMYIIYQRKILILSQNHANVDN